jgi:hypothetical protein
MLKPKNNCMKLFIPLSAAILAAVNLCAAPVPPPEKLLPQDTLAFVTMPEYAKSCALFEQGPGSKLWADPAMKPFKDKFMAKFNKDIVEPLEKELGVKFADYSGLAQGQFTIAVTAAGWQGKSDKLPQVLVLMDARDKSDQLKKSLADLKKRWVDSGKKIKTEKIRDVEFTTIVMMVEDLKTLGNKIFPDPNEGWESLTPANKKKPAKPAGKDSTEQIELIVGQSDTLFIAGSSAKEIEKILSLQSGGGAQPLGENAQFQADQKLLFRDAQAYGWVNLNALIEVALKAIGDNPPKNNGPMNIDPKQAINALGVGGLKSAAFTFKDGPDGTFMNLFLGVPEAQRKGLIKMFVADAKDAGPAPFVPADAVKYNRWRLSFPKAWETLETTLNDLNPSIMGTLGFFEQALKQQDPNFTIKKSLIGNLGDDVITYEKNPRETTLDGLTSQPTMIMIGTPDPAKLITTIKALANFAPMGGQPGQAAGPKLKEREFQGTKIFSFPPMPKFNMQGQKTGERTLSFCSSSGYIAISFDGLLMEEYLRSAGNPGKSLRATPGLADAAEKVGGMNTGLFGYENQAESLRVLIEILKKDSGSLADLLSITPIGQRLGMGEDSKALKDWCDFSLLPNFDKISKYFGFTVFAGSASADGLTLKFYTPRPPQFK